jgi:hypothetical protein
VAGSSRNKMFFYPDEKKTKNDDKIKEKYDPEYNSRVKVMASVLTCGLTYA